MDLLKVSKQNHYNKYFEDNKNQKILWDGIHQIIYSKKKKYNISLFLLLVNRQTITDKLSISTKISTIFLHQLEKLQNKIYPTNRTTNHTISNVLPQIPSLHQQPDLRK